uniref:Histone acetyltransferase KAT6A n=1 Tax=Anthurium amnicola TaxID=1678845 RepID=A0A1D1ZCQ1_9ARAE
MARVFLPLCRVGIMETKRRGHLHVSLLILVLGLAYFLLSLDAVAISGSLASRNQASSVMHEASQGMFRRPVVFEEELVRGRKDIQVYDYPGSGANDRHDPRNPGRG